jgi:hypothetical protein
MPAKSKLPAKPDTLTAMKRAVRKAERDQPGTGYTRLKQQSGPIQRLLDRRRIGPQELQAAEDITRAFHAIAGALMIRPISMERSDRSASPAEPVATLDAIARYREWSLLWSKRAKRGDPTLEIVVAVVVDERPLRELDGDLRLRNGAASRALIGGLRDYAARAGWLSGGGKVENGAVFRLRRSVGRRRESGMQALARKWDREAAIRVPSPAA